MIVPLYLRSGIMVIVLVRRYSEQYVVDQGKPNLPLFIDRPSSCSSKVISSIAATPVTKVSLWIKFAQLFILTRPINVAVYSATFNQRALCAAHALLRIFTQLAPKDALFVCPHSWPGSPHPLSTILRARARERPKYALCVLSHMYFLTLCVLSQMYFLNNPR